MRQTQYTSPAPRDPRLNYERPGHGFVPSNASTPPDLLELVVEQFEKKMPVPPPHSILKRSSDPLKPAREESIPPRPTFGAHWNYADFQAQYNWRQCLSQSSQEGANLAVQILYTLRFQCHLFSLQPRFSAVLPKAATRMTQA